VNREQIVEQLRRIAQSEVLTLERMRREATQFGDHPDWPWIGRVQSAATHGGSWRWEEKVRPIYESKLSWSAISEILPSERRERLETVGRFWDKTATWLEQAYIKIQSAGGPEALRDRLNLMPAKEVISFWKSFQGFNEKYARNIMMDIYHPNFRNDFFAIDSRLEALLPILGYVGKRNYLSREKFLFDLSGDVGVIAWDLDRLLYSKHKEIKDHFVEK
jgi:hypothetical protein